MLHGSYPNAIVNDNNQAGDQRTYLVVTSLKKQTVERIIRGPSSRSAQSEQLVDTIAQRLLTLEEEYPSPEYEVHMIYGEFQSLKDALPFMRQWNNIEIEQLSPSG